MTPEEANKILTKAAHSGLLPHPADARQATLNAVAWADSLDPDLPLDDALHIVSSLAADTAERAWILPGHINARWRAIKTRRRENELVAAEMTADRHRRADARCARPGCPCTHTACVKGWLQPAGETTGRAVPCRTCRPGLTRRLAAVPPPGERDDLDNKILRGEVGLEEAETA